MMKGLSPVFTSPARPPKNHRKHRQICHFLGIIITAVMLWKLRGISSMKTVERFLEEEKSNFPELAKVWKA